MLGGLLRGGMLRGGGLGGLPRGGIRRGDLGVFWRRGAQEVRSQGIDLRKERGHGLIGFGGESEGGEDGGVEEGDHVDQIAHDDDDDVIMLVVISGEMMES